MGWVSIVRNEALRTIFGIPKSLIPVAYLCVGYVESFPSRPVLEQKGWAERLSPRKLLHFDSWNGGEDGRDALARLVEDPKIWRDIFPGDEEK